MRTGSTWLAKILSEIMDSCYKPHWGNPDAPLTKIHGMYPAELIVRGYKVVSITRDLRDILVSRFCFKKYRREKRTTGDDKAEFNEAIISSSFLPVRRECRLWRMYNGFAHPNYLLVRYEDLKSSPVSEIQRIGAFVGHTLGEEEAREIYWHNFFEYETGRKPGNEDRGGFRRKGIVGDWKNWFTPEAEQWLKALSSQ